MRIIFITLTMILTFTACVEYNLNKEFRFLADKIDFLSFVESDTNQSPSVRCFWMDLDTYSVYDLSPLKRPYNAKEDTNITSGDWTIYYTFCDNIMTRCNNTLSQWGAFKGPDCHGISGPINLGNQWTLLNSTNPDQGVKIFMNSGDACGVDKNKNYTLTLDMVCKANVTDNPNIIGTIDPTACDNKLTFESDYACPNSKVYIALKFLKQYAFFIGAVFIIFGLFLTFLGNKMLTITIFLVTTIVSITLVFLLFFGFILPGGANPAIVWVVLAISLVIGFVCGYLMTKYKKTLIGFTLGAYLGYLAGILLYNAILIQISWHPKVRYINLACILAYYSRLYHSRWVISLFPIHSYCYYCNFLHRWLLCYQRNIIICWFIT
jgi:hypothetical protein